MSTAPSIAAAELQALLAHGAPVTILDVRREPVFAGASDLIDGASWFDPEAVEAWGPLLPRGGALVVYCVHGHGVSQGVAARLQQAGFDARYLEGGIEGWRGAHGRLQAREL